MVLHRIHGKKAKVNFLENAASPVISTRSKKRSSRPKLSQDPTASLSPLPVGPNEGSSKVDYVEEKVVPTGGINSYPSNQFTNSFSDDMKFGTASSMAPAMGNHEAVSGMSDDFSDISSYLDLFLGGGLEESSTDGSVCGFLSDGLLDGGDVTQDLVGNNLWNFDDFIPVVLGTDTEGN